MSILKRTRIIPINLRKLVPLYGPATYQQSRNMALINQNGTVESRPAQVRNTKILSVDPSKIGRLISGGDASASLNGWDVKWQHDTTDFRNLALAAEHIRTSDIPVAFPTETVYGLGADATRSSAVRGIYEAKQRPSDNPLIVHIASFGQLTALLNPQPNHALGHTEFYEEHRGSENAIPEVYRPLIQKFWPGPLTIILPNPRNSVLAPEVTAGLGTFGARMPGNLLALALIQLSGVPLAAPSANASTKPSPTAAEHVMNDLNGRIDYIVDGGPCEVGVESTVVDGLSDPPTILRPGGISLDQLRQCPGWENVQVGYKDTSEKAVAPKAPGMKYRHYSPNATVILYEAGVAHPEPKEIGAQVENRQSVGIIRTRSWPSFCGLDAPAPGMWDPVAHNGFEDANSKPAEQSNGIFPKPEEDLTACTPSETAESHSLETSFAPKPRYFRVSLCRRGSGVEGWEINLGRDIGAIARGLFYALRELDKKDVKVIFVEGIREDEGDMAATVMNRLRKAAEVKVEASWSPTIQN